MSVSSVQRSGSTLTRFAAAFLAVVCSSNLGLGRGLTGVAPPTRPPFARTLTATTGAQSTRRSSAAGRAAHLAACCGSLFEQQRCDIREAAALPTLIDNKLHKHLANSSSACLPQRSRQQHRPIRTSDRPPGASPVAQTPYAILQSSRARLPNVRSPSQTKQTGVFGVSIARYAGD